MTPKPLRINRAALGELRSAARWYQGQRPGLGDEFLAAVAASLERLTRFPEAAPVDVRMPARLGFRSLRVPGFPYVINYRNTPKEIRAFAVAHSSRKPGYWRRR